MPLQGRNYPVVPAPGALRCPLVSLGGPQEESGWYGPENGVLGHQRRHVHSAARKTHNKTILFRRRALFNRTSRTLRNQPTNFSLMIRYPVEVTVHGTVWLPAFVTPTNPGGRSRQIPPRFRDVTGKTPT